MPVPNVFSLNEQITSPKMNANFSAACFSGEIRMYGGSSAPTEWLLCDGSAVSRTTYATLFAVIGTSYGVGDNSTTFNLPDLRDKFPIGISGSKAIGSTGGSATHTHSFTTASSGSHSHTVNSHAHALLDGNIAVSQAGGSSNPSGFSGGHMAVTNANTTSSSPGTDAQGSHTHTGTSDTTSTLPSYQALNYIIKT